MKKTSTVRVNGNRIFKGHKLTIGLDLKIVRRTTAFDRSGRNFSEAEIEVMTPEAVKQTFERIPRSLIALRPEHIPRG